MILRLASRGSALARWQAEHVRDRLLAAHPDLRVEIHIVRTTGDRITGVPLARIGDRGLFTKEVDQAVTSGDADAAVHSLKDLPTRMDDGLAQGAVLAREDPRDAFLPAPVRGGTLRELPAGARVGTSSLRRRALLLHHRPDLLVEDLRGNLDTRLDRLAEGRFDAVILAAAGIRRLGHADLAGQILEPPDWLPAAGQGALAVAIRSGDDATARLVAHLDDDATRAETTAERTFLGALEGGCQIPIGALGRVDGDELRLFGFVSDLDGRAPIRGEVRGSRAEAAALGERLADQLVDRGAGEILDSVRAAHHDLPPASAP